MHIKHQLLFFLISYSYFISAQKICAKEEFLANQNLVLCNTNNWQLVFEDEFNGDELDLQTWQIRPWAQGALYGNKGKEQEFVLSPKN